MKTKVVLGAVVGAYVVGCLLWRQPPGNAPGLAGKPGIEAVFDEHQFDSSCFKVTGQVGAGGAEPLLAHTTGRVWNLYFSKGDYVRRGQLLVKLYNYSFVKAPRTGFVGDVQIAPGQYLTAATQVTTLSRRSSLLVSVLLPTSSRTGTREGDSVQVRALVPPMRNVPGVVEHLEPPGPGGVEIKIKLPSRAPFAIGELVRVWVANKRSAVVGRR